MIVVSESLTTGQITFILRVVIQVLSYGGLFILGLIVLSSVPLTAPVEVHDVLNRTVGQSTATTHILRWISTRVKGKMRDPIPPYHLLFALILFLSYGLFVSISDIGLIGFRACEVAGESFLDFPASVRSDEDARDLVALNLFSGTDPATVHAYRCNAAEPHAFSVNVTVQNCTLWQNSTYADPNEFRDINATDSDALMPLQLSHYNYARSNFLDLNSFYNGAGPQRLSRPLIARGLALVPHEMGLRVVVGVPHLQPYQQVIMPKAMALEVEVGCMALGIKGVEDERDFLPIATTKDIYAMGDAWRDYTGPDYLSGILSETVDILRESLLPLFNRSDKTIDGDLLSYNTSKFGVFDWQTKIRTPSFPEELPFDNFDGVVEHCTHQVHTRIGLPAYKNHTFGPSSCALMQIGGSIIEDGTAKAIQSGMMCASTTQVNMVSATVAVDAAGNVTVDLTRLPSNLNIIEADYWDALPDPRAANTITLTPFGIIRQYILSENDTGPVSHFLFQEEDGTLSSEERFRIGSGTGVGTMFSQVGSVLWASDQDLDGLLTFLEQDFLHANLSAGKVTAWAGELAGSYIQATLGYNGWAARNGEPLTVTSTGGRSATCFDARYGAAFMPLFVVAFVVIIWGIIVVLTATIAYIQQLKIAYGGLTPYTRTVGPDELQEDMVLVWQNNPHTQLEVVPKDTPQD